MNILNIKNILRGRWTLDLRHSPLMDPVTPDTDLLFYVVYIYCKTYSKIHDVCSYDCVIQGNSLCTVMIFMRCVPKPFCPFKRLILCSWPVMNERVFKGDGCAQWSGREGIPAKSCFLPQGIRVPLPWLRSKCYRAALARHP